MCNFEKKVRKAWPRAIKQPLTDKVFAGAHESSRYLGKGWEEASRHYTVKEDTHGTTLAASNP